MIPKAIDNYAAAHTSPESPLLAQLNRETHAGVLQPRMLSGHLQGRLLSMFSKMICPRRILEIGTYTGYSALCLAEGLSDDGQLVTIDINEELEDFTRNFFEKSAFSEKIQYKIGDALQIIPTLDDIFDLVFIDAHKPSYGKYYDLIFNKVRSGGIIIADNVLWSGKVATNNQKIDKDTQYLLDFNQKLHNDPRTENMLLPIRDGLMVAIKK
jgi:caffeoyl-CoA O-methyltransferase